MPPAILSMTASSGMPDVQRAKNGGDAQRIGDRHADEADDGEAADEN